MSCSLERASDAELAITKPARPFAFSADVGARQAEGETPTGADHVLDPLLVLRVHIEGWIGQHEIELAGGIVRVVVVAVHVTTVADVPLQPVHGEVQARQSAGLVGLLDATVGGRVLLVLGNEAGRLHEHAARAAGRVEDAAVEGFDHLGEQLDDAGGRVELAAALALAHRELAEEVFVDPAEHIAFGRLQSGAVEDFDEFGQQVLLKAKVVLGQRTLQQLVALLVSHRRLDGKHRIADGLAYIGASRQRR